MKPGMRMMLMDRVRHEEPHRESEYGGNTRRRMIGYDRDQMRHIPPEGNEAPEYPERGLHAHGWPHDPPWYGGDMPEARKRRDKRGRYMMGGAECDDEEDEDRPRNMRPRSGGNSYGDIYAEGTIWAPGAMNRPMGGMMGGDMSQPVDERTARMWVSKMDGGEHFKLEHTEQLRGSTCPECERWEFYVAMNAMYHDHCESAKKFGTDKPEYYAHLAKEFLMDKDAGPHKLRTYMETIPKK